MLNKIFTVLSLFLVLPILQQTTAKKRQLEPLKPKPGDNPWQVAIQFKAYGHICEGTLITLDHVFTCAVCVKFGLKVFNVYGKLIAGDISVGEKPGEHRQERNISNIVMHPKYNCNEDLHNVAIIQTAEHFEHTFYVHPIKLRHSNPEPYSVCKLAGWESLPLTENRVMLKTNETLDAGVLTQATFTVLYTEACGWPKENKDMICGKFTASENFCARFTGAALVCDNKMSGIYTGSNICHEGDELFNFTSISQLKKYIHRVKRNHTFDISASDYDMIDQTTAPELTVVAIFAAVGIVCIIIFIFI